VDVGNSSAPAFADLDNDGDADAVVGATDGTLRSFRNNGDGSFNELTGTANPFNGVDVGGFSTPGFVEVDSDGDPDIVVGHETGELSAFRNNGDGTFTALPGASNPFSGWDVGDYSAPSFGDLDGDGDVDALLGDDTSPIEVFENITPHGQAIIVNVTAVNDAPTLAGLAGGRLLPREDVNAVPAASRRRRRVRGPGQRIRRGLPRGQRPARRGPAGDPQAKAMRRPDRPGRHRSYLWRRGRRHVFGGFGDTLAVFFNAAASSEAVDALIQNLTYANVSDTPDPSRNLVLGVTTGDRLARRAIDHRPRRPRQR
jgi:hypothetical protein